MEYANVVQSQTCWHSTTLTKCFETLATDPETGIPASDRPRRLGSAGGNNFNVNTMIDRMQLVKDQLLNVPNGLLVGSAAISVLSGGLADAGLIVAVISINCLIGYKTSLSAEIAISSLGPPPTNDVKVKQDGSWDSISPEELVPGDIVQLVNGIVPADCLLITSTGLNVDESMLTGESQNRFKESGVLALDTTLAERQNMLYAGTIITSGQGVGLVVATGLATEIGKIRSLTARTSVRKPELQRQLDDLGTSTAKLACGLCGAFFFVGLARGVSLPEMLKSAVSLAVAAIPEGLTAVGTLSFAFGIEKLKRLGVHCRDLRSVENIGNIHYLCFDKTGTVTANRMLASSFFAGATSYSREELETRIADLPHVSSLLEIAALCSDAVMQGAEISGSPTETALLEAAILGKINSESLRSQSPRVAAEYRANGRMYMTTSHVGGASESMDCASGFLATKGDPQAVLGLCSWVRTVDGRKRMSKGDKKLILSENSRLATLGMRILGFASTGGQSFAAGDATDLVSSSEQDSCEYTWNGLIAISDPPRAGARDLIKKLHSAGINTALITGDQLGTAIAVAEELGFCGEEQLRAVDAKTFVGCSEDERTTLIASGHVFARVTPEEKLQIISLLQNLGNIVAMTGDGVNDSPALRVADIGIAMGKSGSSAARETADLVISDDNLETLQEAIMEGRTIRKNLKQTVQFMLASNYSEILSMLMGLVITGKNVLNPLQLLWVNIITDVFPGLALASRPVSPDIIYEIPGKMGDPLLSAANADAVLRDSLIMTLGVLPHFIGKSGASGIDGTGILTTLVSAQMSYALALGAANDPGNDKNGKYSAVGLTVAASMAVQLAVPFTPFGASMGMARPKLGTAIFNIVLGAAPALVIFFGRKNEGTLIKQDNIGRRHYDL